MKELKQYTILDDTNRNPDSTHLIHKILPVWHLQNYKDTPLFRFFPSPAVGTDQQNLIFRCNLPTKNNLQNSPTDSLGILSTLTSSDDQRDSNSISHKNSLIRSFRMYDILGFISFPHQIVFRPYLPPSTNFRCSLSNDVLLPLAQKNLVSLNLVPVQTTKIQLSNFKTFKKTSRTSYVLLTVRII